MKKSIGFLLFSVSLFLCVPGCGTPEPEVVTDGSDQSAIAEYEAMVAAEGQTMEEAPPEE